jgi:hypothetical protein
MVVEANAYRPMAERRAILEKNISEIPNSIMLSQCRLMTVGPKAPVHPHLKN